MWAGKSGLVEAGYSRLAACPGKDDAILGVLFLREKNRSQVLTWPSALKSTSKFGSYCFSSLISSWTAKEALTSGILTQR